MSKDRVNSNERRSMQQKLPSQSGYQRGHTLQSGHQRFDGSKHSSPSESQVSHTTPWKIQRSISANPDRTTQQPTQPTASTSPQPNPLPPPATPHRQKLLLNYLSQALKHPLLLVGFAWSTALLIAGIAAVSIVHIEPIDQNSANSDATEQLQSKPADEALQPFNSSPTVPSQASSVQPSSRRLRVSAREEANLPFLTLGLVALSCAATSFFLSYRSRPKQVGSRSHLSSKYRRLPRHISSTKNTSKGKSASSPQRNSNLGQSTPVTVIPSEQDHPLDWQEPSVADHLDLRQRRPLSYWL